MCAQSRTFITYVICIYDISYIYLTFLCLLLFIHQIMQQPQPPNDDNNAEPQQELNPEDLDDDNDIGINEIPLIDPTPMRRAFIRLGLLLLLTCHDK